VWVNFSVTLYLNAFQVFLFSLHTFISIFCIYLFIYLSTYRIRHIYIYIYLLRIDKNNTSASLLWYDFFFLLFSLLFWNAGRIERHKTNRFVYAWNTWYIVVIVSLYQGSGNNYVRWAHNEFSSPRRANKPAGLIITRMIRYYEREVLYKDHIPINTIPRFSYYLHIT